MSKLMQYIINWLGGECFLLKDEFAGNASAPLVSPRVCTHIGQLVLDQTDGQFSIVNGEFTWPAQTTPAWGDQDWHALQNDGDGYDVLDSKKLILKFRGAWLTHDDNRACWFGFNLDTTPDTVANAEHTFLRGTGLGGGIRCTSGASDNQDLRDLWSINLGDYFQTAIVLRPYTVGGLHWYPGAAGVFAYGAHFFYRDEAGENSWRRAWHRQLQSRTDPFYPAFSSYNSAGKFDHVLIPCDDEDIWHPLFTPTAKDEITGANATGLDGRALTYAPGIVWIQQDGVWTIQGNQAVSTAVADSILYIQSGEADCWPEVPVVIGDDSVGGGLVIRKSADTGNNRNEWRFCIATGVDGNDTFLIEVDNGVETIKQQADHDWVQGTFDLRVRLDGQEITCYVNHVEVLHEAAAAFNETAEWHGLYADNTAAITFGSTREFIILPRGSTEIDTALNSFS